MRFLFLCCLLGIMSLPTKQSQPQKPKPKQTKPSSTALPITPANARFVRLNTTHGLSNDAVTCIFQDRDGFMWFGTEDGLNRYDGYTFTVFRSDDKNPEHSLPSNHINAVTQDTLGNIWVATQLGVSVLDYKTQVWERFPKDYRDSAGKLIPYRAVMVIADKWGNVWMHGPGLNRINPLTRKFWNYVQKDFKITKDSLKKTGFLPDTIVQTRYHPGNLVYLNGTGNDRNFYFMGADSAAAMIMRYDTSKHDFVMVSRHYLPSRPNAITDDGQHFWFCAEMKFPGEKAITTRLVVLNKQTKTIEFLETSGTPFSVATVGNEVWFGVYRSGIYRFNKHTHKPLSTYRFSAIDQESLPSNNVVAMFQDRSGTVWIGTSEAGLARYVPTPISYFHHNPLDLSSIPSNKVQAILEDSSGTVWIGTQRGLCEFDRTTGRFTSYPRSHPKRPFHINDIWSLCLEKSPNNERSRRLWLGSWGMGLQVFDIAKRKFLRPPPPILGDWANFALPGWVSAVIQTAPDSLYCINWGNSYWTLDLTRIDGLDSAYTRESVYHWGEPKAAYQPGRRRLYPETVWGYLNTELMQDREGTLWSSGEGEGGGKISGLFRKRKNEKWTLIAQANKQDTTALPTDFIHAIYESARGQLWLGTAEGLCLFDRQTLKVRRFALPNNVVVAIQEDNHGNLWCATSKGLVQFNPEKEAVMRLVRPIDGLPSWSFTRGASMKSRRTGELFFGTNEGLCYVHPDSLRPADTKPLVAFTRYAINRENGTDSTLAVLAGTQHFVGGVIELSHRDKGFSFEMAALDYKSSADNEYAYKLDGFDKEWNFTRTRRFANYTSLPDGDYTLRIKAANADGVWNEARASLRIRVRPPFWRTWWFVGLSLALGIALVVGTTRKVSQQRFVRDLERQRERLKAQQAIETAHLEKEIEIQRERLEREIALEKERGRISQDLHDELGPGMTKILLLAGAATHSPEGLQTEEITATAQEVIKSMSAVIWLTKPENDTLQNLIGYIREYAYEYLHQAGIVLDFDSSDTIPQTSMDGDVRRSVFLVVKEALHNVVKHAQASKVMIAIFLPTPHHICILVQDNGKGFDTDSVKNRFGNGLMNMRRRMAEIGGKCSIDRSSEGTGTIVRLEAMW